MGKEGTRFCVTGPKAGTRILPGRRRGDQICLLMQRGDQKELVTGHYKQMAPLFFESANRLHGVIEK